MSLDLTKILHQFVIGTNTLQHEKKPTISLIFPLIQTISRGLEQVKTRLHTHECELVVAALMESEKKRFHKAICDGSQNVLLSVFFDPQAKHWASENKIAACQVSILLLCSLLSLVLSYLLLCC